MLVVVATLGDETESTPPGDDPNLSDPLDRSERDSLPEELEQKKQFTRIQVKPYFL